jgi:hypothetical protein
MDKSTRGFHSLNLVLKHEEVDGANSVLILATKDTSVSPQGYPACCSSTSNFMINFPQIEHEAIMR